MHDWIHEELAAIQSRGEYRRLDPWPAPGPYLGRDSAQAINLASNDYLGLTAHPEVRHAASRAALEIGTGATASRLLAGSCDLHAELEATLAAWKGHPSALLFSSGYLAAWGVIPLLAGRGDLILADRLSHACLLDAARLAGATLKRFRHNDLADARRLLAKRASYRRCLLITESLFSMDGDEAPWRALSDLAAAHDAWLLVDEAHAIGTLGPRGAGLTADAPEAAHHLVTLGTLGKSLASAGGFITGPALLREWMINRARSFIFDTALPPPSAAAALAALALIRSHPEWPGQLQAKAARARERLRKAGLDTRAACSHILPVHIGENQRVVQLAAALRERRILAAAIRPPTVPPGSARLRLSISLAHADTDLEAALDTIAELAQERI